MYLSSSSSFGLPAITKVRQVLSHPSFNCHPFDYYKLFHWHSWENIHYVDFKLGSSIHCGDSFLNKLRLSKQTNSIVISRHSKHAHLSILWERSRLYRSDKVFWLVMHLSHDDFLLFMCDSVHYLNMFSYWHLFSVLCCALKVATNFQFSPGLFFSFLTFLSLPLSTCQWLNRCRCMLVFM